MSQYPQPNDKDREEIKRYTEKQKQLEADRSTWETHWQECMTYIVPRKEDVTATLVPGSRRNDELFDSTAIHANQLLAAALHGMLTNPTMRFFDLLMGDPALDQDEEVLDWLQKVAERMYVVMNNSNFQTEVHEIYIDQGGIGTACLFMGEHPDKIVHYNARAMKEIYCDENNLGLIDTVHRKFKWKPRQIIQEFGEDKVPAALVEDYKKGCEDDFQVLHCVHPQDADADPAQKQVFPIRSVYLLPEKNLILSRGGFREMPYAVPRWTKTSGEKYGRGPGMEMLPDIKMVNRMMETTLKGAQKMIDPPMGVEDDGVIGNVRLTPGGITIIRAGAQFPQPLIKDTHVDFGYQMIEDVRKRIRSGFFVDQLQLKDGPQMTATEASLRAEEMLRLMGPVLGRQHFEFLRPVIERNFGIMYRRGLLPPIPKKIQGRRFDVRYSSLAARAQRASDGQNFARALQLAAPIINAKPEVLDNINGDKTLRYITDIYGVPQRIMNTEREKQEIREARAKAQAAAVQQQQKQQQADNVSKILPAAAQIQQAQKQ